MVKPIKLVTETVGEEIVRRAREGVRDVDELVIRKADALHVLEQCDRGTNRKLEEANMEDYKLSIDERGIIDTGESLKFDREGTLIDGQHRLWLIVREDLVFECIVAFGRSTKAFPLIDAAHASRSKVSVFAHAAVTRPAETVGISIWLMRFRDGDLSTGKRRTAESLYYFYCNDVDHDLMLEAVREGERVYLVCGFPKAMLSTLYYMAVQAGRASEVNDFFSALYTGVYRGRTAPVKYAITTRAKWLSTPGIVMKSTMTFALLLTAWNLFMRKQRGSAVLFSRAIHIPEVLL
jgi:hypothetical protein